MSATFWPRPSQRSEINLRATIIAGTRRPICPRGPRSRVNGARFTSGSMLKRWKSGLLRSPAAELAMRPYCPTDWIRSPSINPSAWSRPTAPTTPVPAKRPSRRAERQLYPAPQERQTVERTDSRSSRAQRCPSPFSMPWPGDLEAMDRLSRRSLVEAKMRCFKLLGERAMSRDFERQVAELQIRAQSPPAVFIAAPANSSSGTSRAMDMTSVHNPRPEDHCDLHSAAK